MSGAMCLQCRAHFESPAYTADPEARSRCEFCPGGDCPGFAPETVEFRGTSVEVTDPEPRWKAPITIGDWASEFAGGTFQATFADLFREAFDLLVERQKKYGPENIRVQGIYGVFTRMSADKVERIRAAMNGRVVAGEIQLDPFLDAADETVEDALLDVANYALIMLSLKRGIWGKPLQAGI